MGVFCRQPWSTELIIGNGANDIQISMLISGHRCLYFAAQWSVVQMHLVTVARWYSTHRTLTLNAIKYYPLPLFSVLLAISLSLPISMFQKRLLHSSRSAFNKALTPLTHVKHPEFQRNPAFSKVKHPVNDQSIGTFNWSHIRPSQDHKQRCRVFQDCTSAQQHCAWIWPWEHQHDSVQYRLV